jgi:nucleoside 2-deoxyribosyltransferase
LSYKEATDWRDVAREWLDARNIVAISPMRGKEYLSSLKTISGHGREYLGLGPLSAPAGVLTRDHWDVFRSDVILANLLGAKAVSIGTVMEIAWAHAYRKPVVLVMEPQEEGNPHDHMMITQAVGYQVPSLEAALELVVVLADQHGRKPS